MFTKSKVYIVIAASSIAAHIYNTLRLLLGRIEHVPFHNRVVFVAVISVGMWATHFTALLGMWIMDHPAEPYRCCLVCHYFSEVVCDQRR